MFDKILAPTDFSPASEMAFRYARAIADRFGGSLHLVHVIEEPMIATPLGGAEVFLPGAQQLLEQRQQDAQRQLERLMSGDDCTAFRATTDVLIGPSAGAIVDYAKEHGMELIVMGTHGRIGVAHILLGSVAETVVRKACCPVLTIHTDGELST